MTQLLLAGMDPPVRLMPASPISKVPPDSSHSVPPQLLEVDNGEATVILPAAVGKVSTKLTSLTVPLFGLVRTKVNVDVVPGRIVAGVNDLSMVTDAGSTRLA